MRLYRVASFLCLSEIFVSGSTGHIEDWVEEVNKYANVQTSKILVANKADVSDTDKKVAAEEGRKKAVDLNLQYIETSAKTGQGVRKEHLRYINFSTYAESMI